jgi:hypothetical protein
MVYLLNNQMLKMVIFHVNLIFVGQGPNFVLRKLFRGPDGAGAKMVGSDTRVGTCRVWLW